MTSQHRRANVIAGLTFVVTVGILLMAAAALPAIYRSRDNSGQVAVGNELASCRADARSLIDDANKDLTILIIRGLRATAERDTEQLAAIADESVEAEHNLIDATAAYRKAVDDSIHRQQEFLEECKR